MTRNYYCLVAGLPDLVMEERKLAVSSSVFRDLLQEDLHPQDLKLVNLFFLKNDHQNILNQLFNLGKSVNHGGIFSQAIIEEVTDKKAFEVLEKAPLPDYLMAFLKNFFESEDKPLLAQAERELTNAYFDMLLAVKNDFVRKYTLFEQTTRNIIVALNGRKYNLSVENEIIGSDEVSEALRKSRARDFGLSADVDFLETLMQINENTNVLEREMKLDLLRWQYLDELSFFNYFSIEKVLAFTIKLMIVERWFELDEEKGRTLFKNLLNELKDGYEFPEEFKISHGKKK